MIFDHYEVLKRDDGSPYELGRGAMGITYKAFDTNLHCDVALKVINATYLNSGIARQQFVSEARAAAQLRHRHVGSVFHLGIEGDTYFYAMEFIDGETGEAIIRRRGPLPPIVALRIATQVARALGAAQKHGLVHRDIKPANLMLVQEDEELVVKVIDFGLAKSNRPEGEGRAGRSMPGIVGTPHFASPEQLEDRPIDARSDIYSLGVTLWYLLTGKPPFSGSIEEVIGKQLHDPPPFAQLQKIPKPVVALLGRMLAKDPAQRPQTPIELRTELENCIEEVQRVQAEAGIDPAEGDAALPIGGAQTGKTIKNTLEATGKYRILADLGEGNTGHSFHAERLEPAIPVRLIVLNSDLVERAENQTLIEREVERLQPVEHPNLIRIYSLEQVEGFTVLAREWTEGFSLLDVLRARRELPANEVLQLIRQAAEGIDYALQIGLKRLDLTLYQIQIHFSAPDFDRQRLLRAPVGEWPAFLVKLNPLGVTQELTASETWAGNQTIVSAGAPVSRSASETDCAVAYVQSLGAISYELLGGTLPPVLSAASSRAPIRYTPLSTLSEEGNEVLKRALDPARSFASGREFGDALTGGKVPEPKPRIPAAPPEERKPVPAAEVTPPSVSSPPVIPKEVPPSRSKVPMALAAGAGICVLVVIGFLVVSRFARHPAPPVVASETPAPTAAASPTAAATAAPAPLAQATPAETVMPAPAPSVTSPTPEPPDANAERRNLLKAALAEARADVSDRKLPAAVAGYVKILRDFPEAKTEIELVLGQLRAGPDAVTDAEFDSLRDGITEAAKLDSVSAMMLLGEHLRKKEPSVAFDWYSAAAARGQPEAFTQIGLLYSNGAGVPRDLGKAFSWFQLADAKGDPAGKYLLGECYYLGKGVARNVDQAAAVLKEAAALNDPRAMDLLGTCFLKGTGVPQSDDEAFRWFNAAQQLGNLNALGNLGVLYIKGLGTPANPVKAVELFRKGAAQGNANCMLLYAQSLESGLGVDFPNRTEAESWYKRAAESGVTRAIDWCKQNKVRYNTESPKDAR